MENKRLYGIRGAVCCENSEQDIKFAVENMCSAIFENNKILAEDIVSIQFTMTNDLDAMNPAAALRKSACGNIASSAALFCSVEPPVKGSLPKTIRVLITAYMDNNSKPIHSYSGGAEILRPDFVLTSKEK